MRLFTLFSLLLTSLTATAQDPAKSDLAPCGAPPALTPWLRAYQDRPQDFAAAERSQDTLYAAMQVHLLARDNGTGRFSAERLLDAFCRLNSDFGPSRIRFYFKNDWNLIDSTGWWQHPDIPQGIDMMLANNVPGALNSYFASDVAGNCGYNLPYGGVAVAHSCANASDHTWAHEVGHALSLPHPFIGWEGKTYSTVNPTPDTLTYDYTYFHDSLETQIPAPLDTALVEYLNGSNCSIAADRVCDTKADYLSYRWDCNGQSQSLAQQFDPNGAGFFSDGTLYLSYAADNCQNRFSDEQISIMRANLQSEKIEWLSPGPPQGNITQAPQLLSPTGGQLSPSVGTQLTWSSVPNATHYLVQASRFATYIVKEIDLVTTDTSAVLNGPLLNNQTFYWRVRPFNYWTTCAGFTPSATFKATTATSTSSPDADGWQYYPTLLAPEQPVTLRIPETWLDNTARCQVYDAAGRLVWETEQWLGHTQISLDLPSGNWSAGIYRLVFRHEKGVKVGSLSLVR